MRVAVIHKPYFFPWMGYFSKLSYAHVFIVQDNVLASNRVWVNRSQIVRPDGQPGYITLPIGQKGDTPICDIELSPAVRDESTRRISMSVEHAYARSRCFAEWKSLLKEQFSDIMTKHSCLLDIDMAIVAVLLRLLQLTPLEICFASNLQRKNDPLDNLISNCCETQCDAIILGRGNNDWTAEDTGRLRQAHIEPLVHDFFGAHPEYYQTRRERLGFCRGLSILDCILNEGHEMAASLLKRVPLAHDNKGT